MGAFQGGFWERTSWERGDNERTSQEAAWPCLQKAEKSGEVVTISFRKAGLKWLQAQVEGLDLTLGHWEAMAGFKARQGYNRTFLGQPFWSNKGQNGAWETKEEAGTGPGKCQAIPAEEGRQPSAARGCLLALDLGPCEKQQFGRKMLRSESMGCPGNPWVVTSRRPLAAQACPCKTAPNWARSQLEVGGPADEP